MDGKIDELIDIDSVKDIQVESKVEALILIRKRLGVNQWRFAEMIGVSKGYLNMVENYKVPFSKKLEEKIDQLLTDLKENEGS